MIVDQHQPVVEKYYGSGKMSRVIVRLLEECDRVVKKLIDGWGEDRSMKRKVGSRKRVGLPFHLLFIIDPLSKLSDVSNSTLLVQSSSSPSVRRQTSNAPDEDLVDPREIDKVLTELAGMAGRWSLFKKFLAEQLQANISLYSPAVLLTAVMFRVTKVMKYL